MCFRLMIFFFSPPDTEYTELFPTSFSSADTRYPKIQFNSDVIYFVLALASTIKMFSPIVLLSLQMPIANIRLIFF